MAVQKISRVIATLVLCTMVFGITACVSNDGSALYGKRCDGACHDTERIENATYSSEDEWRECIKRMQAQTTSISDEDADAIAAYLATN